MKNIFILLVFPLLLVGCSQKDTFESFFHKKMMEMNFGEENFSYKLVHKDFEVIHENDAIAVFKENSNQGEKIYIAYFEEVNHQWQWIQTRGSQWNSPVKWSSMNQPPYIYSGAINDNSITEVYAGDEQAEIITIEDDKKFWYAISPIKDTEVMIVKDDGSKEKVEEIKFEE